jgi:hypothetical protein
VTTRTRRLQPYAAIKAAFPDEEPDGDEGKKEGEDAPEKKDGEEPAEKKDAEDEADKKDSKASEDDADKKDSSVVASVDAALRAANARIAALEKKQEGEERASLMASREMSAALAKTLSSKPIALVREICATLPLKSTKAPKSTETVQATRGGTADTASRLPPEESRKLAERMGLRSQSAAIGWDPNMRTTRVFPVLAGATKKEGN